MYLEQVGASLYEKYKKAHEKQNAKKKTLEKHGNLITKQNHIINYPTKINFNITLSVPCECASRAILRYYNFILILY